MAELGFLIAWFVGAVCGSLMTIYFPVYKEWREQRAWENRINAEWDKYWRVTVGR
jgi:hypothetical protein